MHAESWESAVYACPSLAPCLFLEKKSMLTCWRPPGAERNHPSIEPIH